ncbi:MAG TPA: non-reducing end alpha-L-arabinofuranosidase family hydrolase [Polyangiaceae bacterium]|nr:non-reducing end alpha-L-arabinofuranosidase family hydrolase [Polyangiaceae bacterium]
MKAARNSWTVPAFESKRPRWVRSPSFLLVGLLASSSGACSSPGRGAAGTADAGVDASSASGEASSGTDGSLSDGEGGSSGSSNADGSSGDGATVCPLPTAFQWTSTGPLAQPQNGWVSLKDFSDVVYNDQHIVYMSTVTDAGSYGGAMMTFTDWPQMATATQFAISGGAAPTLIYFTPKSIWVLMYEFGEWPFSYVTSPDATNPSSWSSPQPLFTESIADSSSGPLDETVICNSATCYLFFAGDDGSIYRASMTIDDFPSAFTNATIVMTDSTENLFEAVEVYTVKGANQYLMIVEAIGSTGHRYFRSFTATDLGGSWTPLAATESSPFAGAANVTFGDGGAWTSDISSGDMVRNNPDETQTVDPCNLQFLYQGDAPTTGLSYNQLPWRPGLLTLVP